MSEPARTNSPVPDGAGAILRGIDTSSLSHSHIAELSEAFRMLLHCGSAASGHPLIDHNNTMTATVTSMVHGAPQEGPASPKATTVVGTSTHTGHGNATVVNSVTSEQLSSILLSLGVGGPRVEPGSTISPSTAPPGTPSMRRASSFQGRSVFEGGVDPAVTALRVVDEEFGGRISFSDFLMLMLRRVESPEIEEMRSAFRVYDKENTGNIATEQFVELFAACGEQSSPEEIDEMLALADPDNTGVIDYNTFLTTLAKSL